MSEEYLPIKESVGYNNLRDVLKSIFSIELDDIVIREGEDENFAFKFIYCNTEINIVVSATGKSGQFNIGDGGLIYISLPNPKYPNNSFLKNIYFHNLLSDEELVNDVKYTFGKKTESIKRALITLKDYLDSECHKF